MPFPRRFVAAFVLAGLVLPPACGAGSDNGIDVVFDACAPLVVSPAAPVTDEERGGIGDALQMWNDAASTGLTFGPAEGAPDLPVHFQDAFPAQHGFYDDQAGVVYVNADLTDRHLCAIVVAHEIGHAFGLVHVDPSVRTSLMNPDNLTTGPTPADVAALQALWGTCGS